MKVRKVTIMLEVETDATLKSLREKIYYCFTSYSHHTFDVKQAQPNIIRKESNAKNKRIKK